MFDSQHEGKLGEAYLKLVNRQNKTCDFGAAVSFLFMCTRLRDVRGAVMY